MARSKHAPSSRSAASVSSQRPRPSQARPPAASSTAQVRSRAPERVADGRLVRSGVAGRGAARRAAKRRVWYRGPAPLVGIVVGIVAIVAIFIALANRPGTAVAGIGDPVPASVLTKVTTVSPTVFAAVGTGSLPDPLRAVQGQAPLRSSGGKPQLLYVGGEYCPYCAVERWSLVVALSRFGTFSNLRYMASSATDVYPSTHTFTFHGSSYASSYLDLAAIENEDRNQQPLESLDAQQQPLFSSIGGNGFPFVDIANQYANGAGTYSGGYDPQLLQGLDWQQIASKLNNPNDPITKGIVGNANYLTAAICKVTNNEPASVCNAPVIQQIEQALPK